MRTIDLGSRDAGEYITKDKAAYWDGRNDKGEVVASNTYFSVMQAGEFTDTRKMIMVR